MTTKFGLDLRRRDVLLIIALVLVVEEMVEPW